MQAEAILRSTIQPGPSSRGRSFPSYQFEQTFQSLPVPEQVRLLSVYSEEQLSGLLQRSKHLSAISWRIEVMTLGLLADRDQAKRGRGNVDLTRRGIKAMVNEKASELGCSESSVWASIRIFRTFFQNSSTSWSILDERGFYLAALDALDPVGAIKRFARFRQRYGLAFKVADAERWVAKNHKKSELRGRSGKAKATDLALNIETTLDFLEKQRNCCPEIKSATRFYDSIIEDTRDYLDDVLNHLAEIKLTKIFKSSDEKVLTDVQLTEQTGLSTGTVRLLMRQLETSRVVFRPDSNVFAWRNVMRVQNAGENPK